MLKRYSASTMGAPASSNSIIKCPWAGLGSHMKLSVIELKDGIPGNGPGTCDYFLPPAACKIETFKPDDLSLVPI